MRELVVQITTWKKKKLISHGSGNAYFLRPVALHLYIGEVQPDVHSRRCSTWRPSIAMHQSALRQRLWPYSICFLDVYLVCHGGGLTTKRRQPLWTSVHISECMHFRTHVYWTLFLWVLPPLKIFETNFLTSCILVIVAWSVESLQPGFDSRRGQQF